MSVDRAVFYGYRLPAIGKSSKVKARGCEHPETNDNYCGRCGKPMWVNEALREKTDGQRLLDFAWANNCDNFASRYFICNEMTGKYIGIGLAYDMDSLEVSAVSIPSADEVRQKIRDKFGAAFPEIVERITANEPKLFILCS